MRDRARQGLQQAAQPGLHVCIGGQVLDDQEFLAAPAEDFAVFVDHAAQARAGLAQHLVAGGMP